MNVRRLLTLGLACAWSAAIYAAPPKGSITIDRISQIKYPSSPVWSPDGKMIAFLWDAWGKMDLFVCTPGGTPVAMTDFPVDPDILTSDLSGVSWMSPTMLLFTKDGATYSVDPTAAKPTPTPYTSPIGAGGMSYSKDRQWVTFIRDGQVMVAPTDTWQAHAVTTLEPMIISGPSFSPDGQWIVFSSGAGGGGRGNRGGGGAPAAGGRGRAGGGDEGSLMPFNGDRMRVVGQWDRKAAAVASQAATDAAKTPRDSRVGAVPAAGGDVIWTTIPGSAGNLSVTADTSFIWTESGNQSKDRTIYITAIGGATRTLWKDHDERWFTPTGRDSKVLVSPDGKRVAFISDRTGWIQIYVAPVTATGEADVTQMTHGPYLSGLGAWSPDSTKIVYHHATDGNEMERFIDILDVATGKSTPIVTAHGVNYDAAFSPDGTNLLFHRTDVENSLDLYTVPATSGATFTRLSDSMPAGLDKKDLTPPVLVSYKSRLGPEPVPASLMVSKTLDKTTKHPAIVWIHGSGSDQNFLGWHPGSYRMYYSLCQYLAQQGYVILTPDYRGSSGYSRSWSSGVYMGVGVNDTADVAAGADYLKTLPYVDPDRIGVFGLSYGGFLTLQAVTTDPTLWRAAIDVAGVVDWTTYSAGYSTPRLGTPIEHPEIYDISAPILHMDKLARPLLIMQGTNDRNVSFIDSLRLMDNLLKLGKPFESQIYPGEIHFFRKDYVLRDAWTRVEAFFDRELKNGPVMVSK